MDYNSLPKLEILNINDLLIYENFDNRRTTHLVNKIKNENLFTTPILVGKSPDGKMVILDGVNRQMSMRKMGIDHILCHVVDYFDENQVQLFSNKHFFFEVDGNFLKEIEEAIGFKLESVPIGDVLNDGFLDKTIGYLIIENKAYSFGSHNDLSETVDILNKIVDSYLNSRKFSRFSELVGKPNSVKMEIGFHRFSPIDICNLFDLNKGLNSGITCHIPFLSCLQVNLPLDELNSKEDLDKKNERLKKLFNEAIENKYYRYYSQPVFIFNELN